MLKKIFTLIANFFKWILSGSSSAYDHKEMKRRRDKFKKEDEKLSEKSKSIEKDIQKNIEELKKYNEKAKTKTSDDIESQKDADNWFRSNFGND